MFYTRTCEEVHSMIHSLHYINWTILITFIFIRLHIAVWISKYNSIWSIPFTFARGAIFCYFTSCKWCWSSSFLTVWYWRKPYQKFHIYNFHVFDSLTDIKAVTSGVVIYDTYMSQTSYFSHIYFLPIKVSQYINKSQYSLPKYL